jgi:signal transduction histidine kinase
MTLYVYALVSSSLLCSMAFYFLVVRPLASISGQIKGLCLTVDAHPSVETPGGEIAMLREGLQCMAGQWEQNRLKLEEANREELRRMEKLATLGEMAFSVAHDIKNPLAGISGAIQVFAEEFREDDPRGEIVREILGEITRLDRTVRDLQFYARPPEPHPMPTPPHYLLERAVKNTAKNAKKNRVDVTILEGPDNLEVNVDTELLHQALLNIMDFSIRTMQDGGSLVLYARMSTDKDMAEIGLKDTGPGMKGESLETLFKPFRTSRMSARGLAMAISRALVEIHGGSIEVESAPGTGTTFRVMLPVYRENA